MKRTELEKKLEELTLECAITHMHSCTKEAVDARGHVIMLQETIKALDGDKPKLGKVFCLGFVLGVVFGEVLIMVAAILAVH